MVQIIEWFPTHRPTYAKLPMKITVLWTFYLDVDEVEAEHGAAAENNMSITRHKHT